MALEGVGIGLAVLAEVRTNVSCIRDRIACYKQGPELFDNVNSTLSRVICLAGKIKANFEASPDALPKGILDIFSETLNTARQSLQNADNTLHLYRSTEFALIYESWNDYLRRTVVLKGKRFVNGSP